MGCGSSIYLFRNQRRCFDEHDENDLVQIKEINDKTVHETLYYYDNKYNDIIRKENGKFYTTRILEMDEAKVLPLYIDNGEYVFLHYANFIEKMKKKYYEEMRNQIRDEVRKEFDLLLP